MQFEPYVEQPEPEQIGKSVNSAIFERHPASSRYENKSSPRSP